VPKVTEGSVVSQTGRSAGSRPPRVLVFRVDDGLFALHIDWVEAMYPRLSLQPHTVEDEGRNATFVFPGGDPALVLDLRDAFAVSAQMGTAERPELLVVRAPGFLLALPVDSCVGIREVDLEAQPPIPSALVRDGGLPVAYFVALEGRPMVLLDPGHLLETREREALVPLMHKACTSDDDARRGEGLWREICARPSESNLRAYASACSRAGRSKAASAARTVMRHLEQLAAQRSRNGAGDAFDLDTMATTTLAGAETRVPPQERFLRELICLANEKSTGELIVPQGDGAEESRVFLAGGRVVQAHHRAERGSDAFKRILGDFPEHFYFVETISETSEQQISDSTAALLVETLAALGRSPLARRQRPFPRSSNG